MHDRGSSKRGALQVAHALMPEQPREAFLGAERAALDRLVPGLDDKLSAHSLAELESRESPAIDYFRETGASNLLIPAEHAGIGASPVEAVRVQRAIGSRAPSLAIASTMHAFSLAGLLALAAETEAEDSLEWGLLRGFAEQKLLAASGFAEGKSGQGLFAPVMAARRQGANWVLSGSKKPCSLAHSMDLMAASCALVNEAGDSEGYGIAVVAAQLPGVEVEPFWGAPVLTGAESEAVVLRDVEIPDELMIRMGQEGGAGIDELQTIGVVWFALLVTASYLGVASALVERVLAEGKSDATSKVAAAYELEASMASLESVAHEIERGHDVPQLALRALLCRYAAQDAVARAVSSSVEQLGGMAFIGGSEVGYLAGAARALALHPPPRLRSSDALLHALLGGSLTVD